MYVCVCTRVYMAVIRSSLLFASLRFRCRLNARTRVFVYVYLCCLHYYLQCTIKVNLTCRLKDIRSTVQFLWSIMPSCVDILLWNLFVRRFSRCSISRRFTAFRGVREIRSNRPSSDPPSRSFNVEQLKTARRRGRVGEIYVS